MLILDASEETKLQRLYVALAMSREAALHINNKDEASKSTVLLLKVASDMLEEILETQWATDAPDQSAVELLM